MCSQEVSHQRHSATKLPEEGSREPDSLWVVLYAMHCSGQALEKPQALWKPKPGAVAHTAGTQH